MLKMRVAFQPGTAGSKPGAVAVVGPISTIDD